MRVCAIDIGTNSVRLLVAEVGEDDPTEIRTVARSGEPCRLGRGLGATGLIGDEMAERAGHLAAQFLGRGRSLGATLAVVAATAALRSAGNGQQVARHISERIGMPVRILSGEDEARLTYGSVIAGLGVGASRSACVVFDLGGGSTEIVSGIGLRVGRWTSMPIGAVNMTERFLRTDPPTAEEVAGLRAAVREQVMHDCAYMPESAPVLAGVGGTITVLAILDRGDSDYDPGRIDGWRVTPERMAGLVERIVAAPVADRRSWKAMGEGRADIVVAGALVVEAIVARFPSSGLLCSTQGLRFGLARLAATSGDPIPGASEGR